MKKCFISEEEEHQREVNDQIDIQIRKDKKESRYRLELKCVLLGTPGSGKSTFLKQMKILDGGGYSLEERATFTGEVYRNVFQGMQTLILAMGALNIEFSAREICSPLAALLMDVDVVTTILNVEHADTIRTLWADRGIQEVWGRRNEIPYLQDTVNYFFEHIERIGSIEYFPTEEDILRVYTPSDGGVTEFTFEMGLILFRFIEVSSQLCDAETWMNYFDDEVPFIFFVPLNFFNKLSNSNNFCGFETEEVEPVFESANTFSWFKEGAMSNVFDQSKELFRKLISSTKNGIVSVFSKTDLIEEAVLGSDITGYFPEFPILSSSDDVDLIKGGISAMFLRAKSTFSSHYLNNSCFTCLTDTHNVRITIENIKDHILNQYLSCERI